MSFVGIPQACESIAIDLEKLSSKLRQYAQAIRRPDLSAVSHEEHVRSLSRKATEGLQYLITSMDTAAANAAVTKKDPNAAP